MSNRRSSRKETLSVIEEIRRLREGGGGASRLDQYEENEAEDEEDIFETVTADTYKDIVSKRKRDQFVVDGEDDGYYDDGEDNWSEEERDQDGAASKNKRAKRSRLDSPSDKRAKQKKLNKKHRAAAGNRSISSMFAKAPAGTNKPKKKAKMKAFNPKDFNFDDSSDDEDSDVAAIGEQMSAISTPSASFDDDYDENDPSAHNLPISRRSVAEPLSSQTNIPRSAKKDSRKSTHAPRSNGNQSRFGFDEDDDTHMGDLGCTPPSPPQNSSGSPTKKSKLMPRSALRTPGSSKKARWSNNDASSRRVSFAGDDDKIEPVSGSSPPRASDTPVRSASKLIDDDDVKPPPRKASKLDESSSPSEVPQWSMTQSSRSIPTPSKVTPQKNSADASSVPSFALDEGDSLRVYWFDAYEDPYKMPGTVFLFGKVLPPNATEKSEPVSCCVIVHNIERNVYFLPRTKRIRKGREGTAVKQMDVVQEVQHLRESGKISKMKMKFVKRKYSFEARKDGVPYETSYLKATYSFKEPAIPRHMAGETFSRVFGTQTSALEHFIVKRDLMGPCWLNIKNAVPSQNRLSWCKQEFIVDSPKNVAVLRESPLPPTPKFSVMSLRFVEVQNEKSRQKEIVGLTALVHESVSVEGETPEKRPDLLIGCVRPPTNTALPFDFAEKAKAQGRNVKKFVGEREMLSYFLARMQQLDPDVLVGHGLHRFQVELLLQRIKACGVPNWSRVGRLKKSKIPTMNHVERGAASGRLCVDTWVSAKELVHEKTYTLTELCKTRLKKDRSEIDIKQVPVRFRASKSLFQMFDSTYNDCHLQYQLMQELKVLPLTRQLTELCGNLWSRSLQSRRAERNEYLLLHKFHNLKFVAPENYTRKERDAMKAKKSDGDSSSKKKAQYSGGLVLEPERGFYDKLVLLLDYASLYPSIIQEYNICFTTVKHWEMKDDSAIPDEPSRTTESYLPEIIGHLLKRRRAVKALLKDARTQKDRVSLDIRQKALKLVANSMYGCLGFEHSRFYCKPMAALITALGRKSLTLAKEKAEQTKCDPPLKVIYGDTDSIMVHTGIDDMVAARKVAREVQALVNKPFKYMELELDGIFRGMLLLRKKKYAANVVTERHGKMHTERELKGLDLVRRDWCTLSKDLGQRVLNELLSMEQSREDSVSKIHDILTEFRKQLDLNQIPAGKFIITKSLTKDPRQYSDAKTQPHVQVALQMRQEGEHVAQGSHIPYVVVVNAEGGALTKSQQAAESNQHVSNESIAMRSVSAKRVVRQNERNTPKDKWLHIDKQWYLEHQILPPIARLIDVIPETSAGQLAQCLGLDASKYNQRAARVSGAARTDEDDDRYEVDRKDPERFTEWPLEDRVPLGCRHCQANALEQGRPYSPRKWKDVFNLQVDGSYLIKCGVSSCRGNENLLSDNDDVTFLQNALHIHFRTYVERYYRRELQCDDPVCHHRTRAHFSKRCPVTGCQGSLVPMYPASKLFEQLSYYKSCFDLDEAVRRFSLEKKKREESYQVRSRGDPNAERPVTMLDEPLDAVPLEAQPRLQRLHRFVDSLMNSSRHNFVNLTDLFSFAR